MSIFILMHLWFHVIFMKKHCIICKRYNKEFHVKEKLHRNKMNACQQPYHPKCTSSREITEVKQLVSTWMGDHISTQYLVLSTQYCLCVIGILTWQWCIQNFFQNVIELLGQKWAQELGMFQLPTPGFWMGVKPGGSVSQDPNLDQVSCIPSLKDSK